MTNVFYPGIGAVSANRTVGGLLGRIYPHGARNTRQTQTREPYHDHVHFLLL